MFQHAKTTITIRGQSRPVWAIWGQPQKIRNSSFSGICSRESVKVMSSCVTIWLRSWHVLEFSSSTCRWQMLLQRKKLLLARQLLLQSFILLIPVAEKNSSSSSSNPVLGRKGTLSNLPWTRHSILMLHSKRATLCTYFRVRLDLLLSKEAQDGSVDITNPS